MVSFFDFFLLPEIFFQIFFYNESGAVNPRQHRVFFRAAPVSSGDFGQLERVRRQFFRGSDVRTAAEINKAAGFIN
ncbi:MAG: hypothetical protein UX27_C0011G0011 [Candidatus Azambacteria bacterium GW2011_GWA2_45_90]|uniref:Uncharacterized protein n=1 Tax=Candidatus Azambacteria bacterium GW2011_GWA2_45_90 TaxID=1618614 RepID=A0A0G1RDT3_9BACT|nr:MAG: hypothetical protein UX27_C0011G0011 [Candidatus Azambacteria bacterium GW2011_GWA2_45_90]